MRKAAMVFLTCLPAVPVSANPLCEVVASLSRPDAPAPAGAECGTSLSLTGHRDVNCHWRFAYRSEAALQKFEQIKTGLAACLGAGAAVTGDQSVNHPDAYDLREFRLDGQTYAVSIKDKGALRQTLVFLRVPQR